MTLRSTVSDRKGSAIGSGLNRDMLDGGKDLSHNKVDLKSD